MFDRWVPGQPLGCARWVYALAVRNVGIDVVRVLGLLAIVAGHVWENEATWLGFYPWHVPVFFFLTGWLWTSGRTLRDELGKRAQSLGKPYLFWFGIIFVALVAVMVVTDALAPGRLAASVYGGFYATRPFTTFWFVSVLFAAALLWRFIERAPISVRLVIVAAGLAAGPMLGDMLARTPLSIGSALPAIALLGGGSSRAT